MEENAAGLYCMWLNNIPRFSIAQSISFTRIDNAPAFDMRSIRWKHWWWWHLPRNKIHSPILSNNLHFRQLNSRITGIFQVGTNSILQIPAMSALTQKFLKNKPKMLEDNQMQTRRQLPQRHSTSAAHVYLGWLTDRAMHRTPQMLYI